MYSVRNVTLTTTKKSHDAITRAVTHEVSATSALDWASAPVDSAQVLSGSARRYPNAEIQLQFVGNSFLTPARIPGCHLSDPWVGWGWRWNWPDVAITS